MKFSVIIPTYNREKDLHICLESIFKQTHKPIEVLIVDDSNNNETKALINNLESIYLDNHISLHYIKNWKNKSSAIARNIGIYKSIGDVLLFLDDDLILDKEYISNLNEAYNSNDTLIGMQGNILNFPKTNFFVDIYNRIFLLNFIETGKCRVLKSGRITYPIIKDNKPINCEWLSGCNHSYKRDILNKFQFDEKLTRYSFKEDVDLSYRIYKEYPLGLIFLPSARCIHNESKSSRILKKEQIYMEIGYTAYFFYKNIEQSHINKLLFLWSNFGFFVKKIGEILLKSNSERFKQIKYLIMGELNMLKHLSEIKKGELSDLNKSIFLN